MRFTVPTWTIVLPLVVLHTWAWVYFGGKAWDRFIGPRLLAWGMHRWGDRHGYDRAEVDRVLRDHPDRIAQMVYRQRIDPPSPNPEQGRTEQP